MEEKVLERIRKARINKGYSYENMANELNISTSAYRKIELNETKLTLERLCQISNALETKIEQFLGISPNKIYKQTVAENGFGYQDIKHLYTENKEVSAKLIDQYEKRLQEKDDIIKLLKK